MSPRSARPSAPKKTVSAGFGTGRADVLSCNARPAPSTGSLRASLGLAKAFRPLTSARPTAPCSPKASAMWLSPDDEAEIRREFGRLTNLSQAELRAWLEGPQSRAVGM